MLKGKAVGSWSRKLKQTSIIEMNRSSKAAEVSTQSSRKVKKKRKGKKGRLQTIVFVLVLHGYSIFMVLNFRPK